jgi:hypothetical protein
MGHRAQAVTAALAPHRQFLEVQLPTRAEAAAESALTRERQILLVRAALVAVETEPREAEQRAIPVLLILVVAVVEVAAVAPQTGVLAAPAS